MTGTISTAKRFGSTAAPSPDRPRDTERSRNGGGCDTAPKVEISLLKGREQVFPFTAIEQEWEYDKDRLLVYKTIPFAGLEKGKYTVEFRVSDQIREASVIQKVDFVVTEPSPQPALPNR